MYVKVTDGAVIRILNIDHPKQRQIYEELLDNNTGYEVVVDDNGEPKKFSEDTIKDTLDAARKANHMVEKTKITAPRHKGTADIE